MPMPPLRLKPHLSYGEIGKRYRSCKNPVEKSYWHLIWLMANPKKMILVTEASEAVGFCENWARIIVHRYNDGGIDEFIDKRRNNPGKKPILNKKQRKELIRLLTKERPKDGGLWTGPKVAHWITEKTGKPITAVGAWKWIRKSGFTLQVPRPKHIRSASVDETEAFKKNWLPSV
jgi:transposase